MKIILSSRRRHYVVRVSILLIVVALIAGMVGCSGNPASSEIYDWYDLDAIRHNLDGDYILMNDLDSTTAGYAELASPAANEGKGWEPIGTSDHYFTGTLDGQGYEICDFLINRPDQDAVGLFGLLYRAAVIKNLGVMNFNVTGNNGVGSLIGYALPYDIDDTLPTVSNCYAIGSVTGNYDVGGLMGQGDGTVSNCYSGANVTGGCGVGGLIGANQNIINNSYSTGSVTGDDSVGGLAGFLYYGTVSHSYSSGDVTGNSSVGGLVGNIDQSTVNNSYSTGNVTGSYHVGGLVGQNWCCGVVVSECFWDTETSGQATSDGGTGKNTTEMQEFTTFSGAGWNITVVANSSIRSTSYIWNIVDDVTYPFLSWEPVS